MNIAKRIALALIACLALAGFATTASAQELKIGYVDIQRAMLGTNEGQSLRSQLEQQMQAREAELTRRQTEVATFAQEIETGFEMLTPEAQAQKVQEYQQRVQELQGLYEQYQQEVAQAEMQGTSQIGERLIDVIATIAQERGYTVVIEKSALLYGLPADEFTQAVIDRYNSQN